MFFRLALAREVEVAPLLADFARLSPRELLATFFGGAEFVERFVDPVVRRGERPWRPDQDAPAPDLVAWAARCLPLSASGRRRVRQATGGWPELLHAVLSDPTMQGMLAPDSAATGAGYLSALKAIAGFDGGLELADIARVRGWLHSSDGGPARVEVWADGSFLAAGFADRFRRDVQHRRGGDGIAGFDIALPRLDVPQGCFVTLEARTADGGVIGRVEIPAAPPSLDSVAALRAEIGQVRAVLDRLEQGLPDVLHGLTWPLSRYDQYFDAHYRKQPEAPSARAGVVAVLVDGAGASARALEECLQSLFAQSAPAAEIAVVVSEAEAAAARDLVARATWRGQTAPRLVVSDATTRAERLTALMKDLSAGASIVLFTEAQAIVADACLAAIAAVFETGAPAAVYFDEDRLDPGTADLDPADRPHCEPIFRSGPDLELLRQTPFVGATIAFDRAAAASLSLAPAAKDLCAAEAVLRLMERGGDIRHLARVLVTRREPQADEAGLWGEAVGRLLGATAQVAPFADILGCRVPNAVQIRHPVPEGVRATLIIPTRDRLDLLRPCIDSIVERKATNRVSADILVVDHECRDPEVVAYLASGVERGVFSVMPFKGPFNWALMNNLAAATATGEVLVFVNDDIVALSPDWLDVLASECLRPDVAVAGCRLLYQDGTIQHAGFVTRDQPSSWAFHEGVGAPGHDAGYLGRHALTRSVPMVTGACMAVASETFRALGGFDAAVLPVEYNDVDLCCRARSRGLKVIYTPRATLYHLESKSRGLNTTPEKVAASISAGRLAWTRWGERLDADPSFNAHFARTGTPFELLRPPQ